MKFLSISSALALLLISQVAVALPFITGSIDITGNSIVLDDGGTPASATGINWLDLDPGTAGDQGVVSAASGDFSSLQTFPQTIATLTDFNFAAVNGGTSVSPLWSSSDGSNTFTFELSTVTVDDFVQGSLLKLSGTGIIRANGFADTFGSWDYTSQSGLSFSSSTVPEPSIAALIGVGLLGFGFLSRRQKKVS